MPTRAGQIDALEVALGSPVANLDYYAKLPGVRMSLVLARTVRNLIAAGLLAPDNSGWLVNPASGVLAGMMGLADPGPNDEYMRVEIGRASCRERVCQYVEASVVGVTLTNKKK